MNTFRLPQFAWYDPKEVDYSLPDNWKVDVYNIAGYLRPVMSAGEIKTAIASPLGTPQVREIARGKKKVVIIFDDMSRGTQVSKIVPAVLEELAGAGISDNQIEFICALGAHQAWDRVSLSRKLGDDIIGRFPVYNHCPFLNCTDLGTTSYGSKVSVNSEVMSADLKIAIGGMVPHARYGFGGGAKIVMPGISSYESIAEHHGARHRAWRQGRRHFAPHEMGAVEANPYVLDAMEMARMVGLDFVINAMMNHRGQTVAIFAGGPEQAFSAGVEAAKPHYRVDAPLDNDIVIANSYCKENEYTIGMNIGFHHVNRSGGDIVVVGNSALGLIIHYLNGILGNTVGGRNYSKTVIPEYVNHVIIYSKFPEANVRHRFARPDKVLLLEDWTEVVLTLEKYHRANAKVAIFPSAEIQISI